MKIESLETTAHHFEVRKKDVYELLRGEKYLKPSKKCEHTPSTEPPPSKQTKVEILKSAHHIVTTLLTPPSAEDQTAASTSME